jgi:hypothetical protein
VGFGLTFLVVAVLASMQWAYIPGVILLVLGAILGIANASSVDLLWPAALVVGGFVLIWQFARKR